MDVAQETRRGLTGQRTMSTADEWCIKRGEEKTMGRWDRPAKAEAGSHRGRTDHFFSLVPLR